jgi:hypothetical protein
MNNMHAIAFACWAPRRHTHPPALRSDVTALSGKSKGAKRSRQLKTFQVDLQYPPAAAAAAASPTPGSSSSSSAAAAAKAAAAAAAAGGGSSNPVSPMQPALGAGACGVRGVCVNVGAGPVELGCVGLPSPLQRPPRHQASRPLHVPLPRRLLPSQPPAAASGRLCCTLTPRGASSWCGRRDAPQLVGWV